MVGHDREYVESEYPDRRHGALIRQNLVDVLS
jgi:hypothetical protein